MCPCSVRRYWSQQGNSARSCMRRDMGRARTQQQSGELLGELRARGALAGGGACQDLVHVDGARQRVRRRLLQRTLRAPAAPVSSCQHATRRPYSGGMLPGMNVPGQCAAYQTAGPCMTQPMDSASLSSKGQCCQRGSTKARASEHITRISV